MTDEPEVTTAPTPRPSYMCRNCGVLTQEWVERDSIARMRTVGGAELLKVELVVTSTDPEDRVYLCKDCLLTLVMHWTQAMLARGVRPEGRIVRA